MSQFLLDRLGRCLKLFVSSESTSCHKFASQFGLTIFYTRKTSKTIANTASHTRLLIRMKHRPAIHGQRNRRKDGVSSSWLGAHRPCNTDNLDSDGSGWVGLCARVCVRVCVHVWACARACMLACVRACLRVCVRARVMCLQYTILIFDPG